MNRYPIITFGMFVLTCTVVYYLVSSELREEKEVYTRELGNEVVVGFDTLLIVDYNSLMGTFKLSNGSEIAKELIILKLINKPWTSPEKSKK